MGSSWDSRQVDRAEIGRDPDAVIVPTAALPDRLRAVLGGYQRRFRPTAPDVSPRAVTDRAAPIGTFVCAELYMAGVRMKWTGRQARRGALYPRLLGER